MTLLTCPLRNILSSHGAVPIERAVDRAQVAVQKRTLENGIPVRDPDDSTLDAAQMTAHVSEVAAEIIQQRRIPLDFSVESLRLVDRILSSVRAQNASATRAEWIAYDLGGYLGEVLIRLHGARWVDFDKAQRELFSVTLGVQMSDGRIWNPIGVARRRIEQEDAISVHHFYLTVHGRHRFDVQNSLAPNGS